jgi:hypothetical protein
MVGSLLVAALIVIVAMLIVSAKFGPTPADSDDHGGDKQEQEDHSGKGS